MLSCSAPDIMNTDAKAKPPMVQKTPQGKRQYHMKRVECKDYMDTATVPSDCHYHFVICFMVYEATVVIGIWDIGSS